MRVQNVLKWLEQISDAEIFVAEQMKNLTRKMVQPDMTAALERPTPSNFKIQAGRRHHDHAQTDQRGPGACKPRRADTAHYADRIDSEAQDRFEVAGITDRSKN